MARPAKKAAPKKSAKVAPAKKTESKSATKAPVKRASAAVADKPAAKPIPAPPVAPAAKPAPPKKRKGNAAGLTPTELATIRQELYEHRDLYRRELDELEAGTFNQSQSDLSGEVSFDEESADAGTFTFERERDLSLGNNIRDLLEKVTSALKRMDAGTYGECERCGRPIDKARLRALPYAVLCIDCKKAEERVR
ncbi:MAG: TraR/DksA family transcriptional regulator [Actinomycetota bacterium]